MTSIKLIIKILLKLPQAKQLCGFYLFYVH